MGRGRQGEGGGGGGLGYLAPNAPLSRGLLYQLHRCVLQLKSIRELDKVKGLKLEELWLQGNPFCSKYADQSAYVR